MAPTVFLPTPTDSWIQGICQRFTRATGWRLRYETAQKNPFPPLGAGEPEAGPLWQKELHGDNGLSGRLVLDRPDDALMERDFLQIRELAELFAELVSQAESTNWQLECRSQELATLVDIGRFVPSEDNLTSALYRFIQATVQLTGFRSAALFLLEPSGERVRLKAEYHQEPRTVPFPERDLVMEAPDFQALKFGRAQVAADASPVESLWLPRGTATGVVLSVQLEEEPLGTLWAFDRRRREPEPREWHILESICAQIASVFERTVLQYESTAGHRLRHDVRVASESQTRDIFQNLPAEIGFEAAGFCTSRFELGGDLCEAIAVDAQRVVILLGDACGDSIPAALVMSAVRGAVHSLVGPANSLVLQTDQMMKRLNHALLAVTPPHQFMSLVYLVIDTQRRTLTYTNAGHPAPIYVHQGKVRELESHGMLAGVLKDATYGSSTCQISPGDVLVLFSDGITEAMSDCCTLFRSRGIIETVNDCQNQSAKRVLEAITERVSAHTGKAVDDDDRTLAVIRFR